MIDRKYCRCVMCGIKLYAENDTYEQDPAYEINGETVCEDCSRDYLDTYCKKVIKEG